MCTDSLWTAAAIVYHARVMLNGEATESGTAPAGPQSDITNSSQEVGQRPHAGQFEVTATRPVDNHSCCGGADETQGSWCISVVPAAAGRARAVRYVCSTLLGVDGKVLESVSAAMGM
jgi:hypothetical protein